MPKLESEVDDPRFTGGIDLLRRSGMREFQCRFDDVQEPIVWVTVAGYSVHGKGGRPSGTGKINSYRSGCGPNPLLAVLDLCDKVLSGGACLHCARPTMFDENFGEVVLDKYFCWYQWDPEVKTFRRGCEGETDL